MIYFAAFSNVSTFWGDVQLKHYCLIEYDQFLQLLFNYAPNRLSMRLNDQKCPPHSLYLMHMMHWFQLQLVHHQQTFYPDDGYHACCKHQQMFQLRQLTIQSEIILNIINFIIMQSVIRIIIIFVPYFDVTYEGRHFHLGI